MVGRVVDVRPVDECRDAGVQAFQRAGEVARVDVLGSILRRKRIEDLVEVVIKRRIGSAAANRRLPGVTVGVDKARDDYPSGAVNHAGIGIDPHVDTGDPVVLDQDVPAGRSPISESIVRTVPPLRRTLPMLLPPSGVVNGQYAASCRTALTSLSTVGMTRSSSASANGSGTHSAATRRIGASSDSNPSSATSDATVAPQPPW